MTTEEGREKLGREERYKYSGGWQGGWDSRSRDRSNCSIKRCVFMDIQLFGSFDLKGNSASFGIYSSS